MNKLVFTCIILLNISQLFAQIKSEPIEIKKGFMGRNYYTQNNRVLNTPQLFKISSTDDAALKNVQTARKNFYPMILTETAGSTILILGLLSAWVDSLGEPINNKARTPFLIILGGGLIGISIPLAKSYSKHLKNAVIIYNDGLKNKEMNNIDLKIDITNNNIGLNIIF